MKTFNQFIQSETKNFCEQYGTDIPRRLYQRIQSYDTMAKMWDGCGSAGLMLTVLAAIDHSNYTSGLLNFSAKVLQSIQQSTKTSTWNRFDPALMKGLIMVLQEIAEMGTIPNDLDSPIKLCKARVKQQQPIDQHLVGVLEELKTNCAKAALQANTVWVYSLDVMENRTGTGYKEAFERNAALLNEFCPNPFLGWTG